MPTKNDFWNKKLVPQISSNAKRVAVKWFKEQFKRLTTVKGKSNSTTRVDIGKMYAYQYDPKWKEILPLYDTQPLTIVIEKYNNGFLGLNMHYLPLSQRYRLLSALTKLAEGDLTNDLDRMIISYRILQSAARSSLYKPTIHRYLSNHVRTKFSLIHPQDWQLALALPIAKFKKGKPY